jgi:hypothetical protein
MTDLALPLPPALNGWLAHCVAEISGRASAAMNAEWDLHR